MQGIHVLSAQGPSGEKQEWTLGQEDYQVGRSDGTIDQTRLAVEGDPLLSRRHFHLSVREGMLVVERCEQARNPIFFQGREEDRFEVRPGQYFLSGNTRFYFSVRGSERTPPATEFTLLHTERHMAREQRPAECFRAMVELLPELRESTSQASAFERALKVLSGLLPQAAELKVLKVELPEDGGRPEAEVLYERRDPARLEPTPPSRGLLQRAFENRGTVTHVWSREEAAAGNITQHARADWAVASPVTVAGHENYALYALGSATAAWTETQVQRQKEYLDQLAVLVDIVAEALGHHLAVQRVNRFEGQVGQFFSPALREQLSRSGFESVLRPTRKKVTAVFFDLRGFSRATEAAEDEDVALEHILAHHSALIEVMTAVTECVFAEGGIVIDYLGDAALACWGALEAAHQVERAVRAARAIVERIYAMDLPFAQHKGGRILRCGLGIASGEGIAGQIGARDQVKFGVMGTVVNLASRLEGLTKYIGVPILANAELAAALPEEVPHRRIGRVRPSGMNEAVEIYEIVVAERHGGSGLSAAEVACYEEASHKFAEGDFACAYEELLRGSRPTDPIGRFLTRKTLQYLDDGAPAGWDGTIEFRSK